MAKATFHLRIDCSVFVVLPCRYKNVMPHTVGYIHRRHFWDIFRRRRMNIAGTVHHSVIQFIYLWCVPRKKYWLCFYAACHTNICQNKNIVDFSKVIEEKVYISYQDKEHIAYIKGIDEDYNKVVRIATTMLTGLYTDIFTEKSVIVSDGVARSLQLYLDNRTPAKLMVPKPGEGLITSETEDFNSIYAFTSGVFYLNENTNQQVLTSLEMAQELLGDEKKEGLIMVWMSC